MDSKKIKSRLSTLKSERMTFETLWDEVGQFIIPRKKNVLTKRMAGEDLQVDLYDNTAIQANELLAGALHSLLTNPNSEWFELTTGDDGLDKKDSVRKYLQALATKAHHVLNASNFQTEVHELYLDLGAFGTATMAIEEDDRDTVRFCCKFVADVYIEESSRGQVNEVYLQYEWTARQIVSEYGEDKLPEMVKKAYESDDNKRFKVVHCIYPTDYAKEKEAGTAEAKGHKFISKHIVLDAPDDQAIIEESGFRTFPMVVTRWAKASGEKYGRSPGMVALPEAKVLNKMVETTLIGAQKVVDPPLQAPDDGFITDVNTYPGGITFYRAGSQDQIRPIFNDARIDFGFQAIQEKQGKIRDAFYTNQLQLGTGPQMTATEVNQRVQENFRFLGPMLGRQQHEFLRPLIDRLVDIMFKREVVSPGDIPPELRGKRIDVRYSSYIAKAQRLGDGQSIMQAVGALEPFVNADSTVLDNLDGNTAVRRIWSIYGAPQDLLRDQPEVEKIRKSRADAQAAAIQQQQQQAQVEQVSKVLPAMAQAQQQGG